MCVLKFSPSPYLYFIDVIRLVYVVSFMLVNNWALKSWARFLFCQCLMSFAFDCFLISLSFTVYKKHYPPSFNDDVWRLEKIGKDGSFHKRLNKASIYTVEDFLRLVVKDPQRLRSVRSKYQLFCKMFHILHFSLTSSFLVADPWKWHVK